MTNTVRRVLRKNEVCTALGWAPSTLYENINKGLFPAPLKDGPKMSRWLEAWVIEHQQKLLAEHKLRQRQFDDNAPAFRRAVTDRKVLANRRRRVAKRAEANTA